MKTSTKLMISALVILIISIGIYNRALKAEYLTGNFKNPYRNYKAIAVKDFTEVEINAAKMMDVEFKQGPFAVYKANYSSDTVTFNKVGNKLIVNVDLPEKPIESKGYTDQDEDRYDYSHEGIIICCPNLKVLKTSNVFLVKGKVLGNFNYNKDSKYSHREILIAKFTADSLTLIQNGNSQVVLSASKINNLIMSADNCASFKVQEGNTITNASLQIKAKAELWLNNISFPKLSYQISDSARVTLYGKSINNFIKK
jgi:hypothetical protein